MAATFKLFKPYPSFNFKNLKEVEINEPDKIKSFAQLLAHESYHTGQVGLLRRVLGKEGKLK